MQFAVYEKPADFPNSFVVRKWFIDPGSTEPRPDRNPCIIGPTLEAVREQIPAGLTRIERLPADDPVIVEVWI